MIETQLEKQVFTVHCYSKPHVDFQIKVRIVTAFLEKSNFLFQAGSIAKQVDEWHEITLDN